MRYNARALEPFTWKRYITRWIPRFFSPVYFNSFFSIVLITRVLIKFFLQPSACLDAMTNTDFATTPTNACKLSRLHFCRICVIIIDFSLVSIDANWDGRESCATSASAIQVVFTDLANNRGSVTAMKVGVVCFAIKILTTAPITNPARTAAPVLTRDKVLTPVPALPNTLEPIASWSKMTALSFLVSTVEPVR